MFVCPCIVRIIRYWWPIRCNFLFIYLYPISSTCFGRCFRPSSGALDRIYSFWYSPTMLLSVGVTDGISFVMMGVCFQAGWVCVWIRVVYGRIRKNSQHGCDNMTGNCADWITMTKISKIYFSYRGRPVVFSNWKKYKLFWFPPNRTMCIL